MLLAFSTKFLSRPCPGASLWVGFFLIVSSSAGPSLAQEWTRFRGPNGTGQGQADNLPHHWQETDILWKQEIPGKGHASPVLWGNIVFMVSADHDQGTRTIHALDATTGKFLWSKEYPAASHRIHAQNSFASSTPTCDAEKVYVAWATPEEYTVVALTHSGEQAWKFSQGGYSSRHGFGSSPILYQDLLITTNDQDGPSSVLALDIANGKPRWTVQRQVHQEQNASYATPILFQPGGDKAAATELIINSWGHGVSSLNPANGQTNWEFRAFERRPVGSPIVVDGLILGNCGEGGGDNAVAAVRPPRDGKPAELAFSLDRSSAPYVPSLIARDNLVFLWGDKGIVICIRVVNGKYELLWRERVGGNFSGSPVLVGDRLFCVSADGEVVVLAATEKPQVLARNQLGEVCRSTPAVANGRMYIRTESHLFCIGR
ncbi:MAG: PQQ-binding-like beta-propeller repeat protein [Pirellulales bacterium]|nr:PQQ-binding-like beta-propeller repeat protein [Pirellulales bacterium]